MEKFLVLENLSDLGSWVTIISFFFTLFSAYVLFKVKKKFLFRTNMAQSCQDIANKTKEVANLLGNYSNNKDEILELIIRIDVILRYLEKGASENFLKDIKKCRKEIKAYTRKPRFNNNNKNQTETKLREIKTLLTVIFDESSFVKQSLTIGD